MPTDSSNGGRANLPASVALRLLDRESPEGYRESWTAQIAVRPRVAEPGTQSVVAFRIGTEWLALPANVFHGVMERRPVHALPHRRGGIVLGITNVNGELLICVSLAALLGVAAAAVDVGNAHGTIYPRLLVAQGEGGRVAFPVDEVYGMHRYHPRDLHDVPETLVRAGTRFTHGLLPWRDTVLACLDGGLVFYAINKGLA